MIYITSGHPISECDALAKIGNIEYGLKVNA